MKLFLKKYRIFYFVLSTVTSFSQNSKQKEYDSLQMAFKNHTVDTLKIGTLNELSRFYLYNNSTEGLLYANKSLSLSKKIKWEKGIGISYRSLGMHNVSLGNYKLSEEYFKISENKLKVSNDKVELALLYNQLGILKANKGDFLNSLDYFLRAMQLYEAQINKKQKFLAALYENIGTVYNFTNEYNKAISFYKKSIIAYTKCNNKEVETALVMGNLGIVYQKTNRSNEALIQYNLANELLKSNPNDFASGFINSWLGSVFLEMKKFDLSILKSKLALMYVEKTKDKELTATTLQNLGICFLEKGSYTSNKLELENGFENLNKSNFLHEQLDNKEGLIKDFLYLSKYYELKNDLKNSLAYQKKYATVKDLVFNQKSKQSLKNLEDKREIQLRDNEIKIKNVSLIAKEKQKFYFIIGLFLLTIIGSLLYYQSRNRKLNNQKLQLLNLELDQANKAKTRFFSILNHDLRGPVANLVNFLQLQKENPELLDEESIRRMQDKTMTGAENLLNSMEDILQWSKSQMENFKPQPKNILVSDLFKDTKTHFASEEKVEIVFENTENIQIITDENYLKTIIRNLTGNAIKALDSFMPRNDNENPTIIWKAWQENNQNFLSITDNGKGATNEQFKALYDDKEVVGIKSGLGLHLIRDLAKAINCEIKVDSKKDVGTTFILIL